MAIDPEGWVKDREYVQRNLAETLKEFLAERAASVAWLRGLTEPTADPKPDWNHSYEHQEFGRISAGDLFASWVAHDALHLRQMAKRLFQAVLRDAAPHTPDYAGSWNPSA